MSIDTKK